MGCSTSRLDQLPAVSLCHHRCKFLEEALYQSYAFADAHVAYMHSLKALGPALRSFFDQNLDKNHSDSSPDVQKNSSFPSPDHYPSSSNSDSHLDFPSDSEDEELGEKDFDVLHSINPNYFDRQNPTPSRSESSTCLHHNKYDYNANSGGLFGSSADGGSWKTPSPPPPPSGSTWEFLNFFDTYERYELPTKSGGDSVNMAEEKKQNKPKINVKQKNVPVVGTRERPEKEEKKDKKGSPETKNLSSQDIIKQLEANFEKAAESGNEVLKILDTGKFRYYDKNSIYQGVSSKMLHVVSAPFLVMPTKSIEFLSSSAEKNGSFGIDEEAVNLSSILKKLCMWEKKLYDEVKAEEKLRLMLVRNYRQMKNMGEKGADNNKVDSARTLIRALSTKVKVAIQVIDRTSITINNLRDEELWPLITHLIHKLLGMWKAMVECHRCQSQAVVEAKSLDAIVSNRNFNETNLESAIQLKIQLQNWNINFSNWITAQRCYVKALNSWLLKCFLPYEPQEIPDETSTPPPVFEFLSQWSAATGKVSEVEVVDAIGGFFRNLNQVVERNYINLADKNLDKRMKILEKEDKRLQRVLQARGSRFHGGGVHRSEVTHDTSSLGLDLKQTLVAIEKFCVNNVQVYEELHLRIQNPSHSD